MTSGIQMIQDPSRIKLEDRCVKCNKLLYKYTVGDYAETDAIKRRSIEIKCPKCGYVNKT